MRSSFFISLLGSAFKMQSPCLTFSTLDPAIKNIQTKLLENTKKDSWWWNAQEGIGVVKTSGLHSPFLSFILQAVGLSQCTSEAALSTWVIVVGSSLHAALRQCHPPQAEEQGFTPPWIWERIIVLYSTAQSICSFWKHILTASQIMLVSFLPLSRQCVLWTWLKKVLQSDWF